MRALLGGLIGLASKALPVGLGMASVFLGQALLARTVGIETFGTYAYVLTWITAAALLSKAGHEWILLKVLRGHIDRGEHGEARFILIRGVKAVTRRAAIAATVLVILAALTNAAGRGFDLGLGVSATLVLVGLALTELRRAWGLAHGATWLADAPDNMLKPWLLWMGAVGMTAAGHLPGPVGLLWLNGLLTVATLALGTGLLLLVKHRELLRTPARPLDVSSHDSLMRSMWLTNFLNIVLRNADIIVVGSLGDFGTTGLYVAASRIAALASGPVQILDRIVAPRIARAAEEKQPKTLRSISTEYSALATAGCLSLVIIFVASGARFATTLFGPEFDNAMQIVWVLLIGHVATSLTGPTGVLLSMSGSHRASLAIAASSAAIYVTLLLMLTPLFQATGAAIAFSAATVVKNLLQTTVVVRRLELNPTLFPLPRWRRRTD